MAITSYCKKCGQDVPVGDTCPHCGAKLAKTAARAAWCVDHYPARDWISWNGAMRILLPVAAAALALILLLEGMAGGLEAVEALLRGGLVTSILGLLALALLALLAVLMLQGDDWLDCAVDSKGVHVSCYLPNPTPMKLLLRLKSPRLMQEADPEDEVPTVLLYRQDLAWKDVARVQLWPEKTLILFYAPAWWMRVALPCTPFTYEDSLSLIREKLGRKKAVALPEELIAPPKPKAPKVKEPQVQQMSFMDMPYPEPEPQEAFVPLEDVFEEIRAAEETDAAPQDP